MANVASRVYKPADFSEGLWHEVLVTLGKKGFSPEMAADVANTKSGQAEQIVGLFSVKMDVSAILTTHHSFYHQFFGLDLDLSTVRIPPQRPDFTRPLIIAQGLTPNQVYEVCQKRFPYSKYADDLDSVLDWDEEERNPKDGAYAIWVRDRVEADVELKNLSADQIKEKGLTTETLLERLLHGLMYWSETNKHLDTNTVTLCTGSRSRRGNVPNADWHRDRDEFRVGWCGPRSAHGNLRARAVVS